MTSRGLEFEKRGVAVVFDADPSLSGGKFAGISGVSFVGYAACVGEVRAKPWQVRCAPKSGYVARVATVSEGAAVVAAWHQVGSVLEHDADLRLVRISSVRMAADFVSGQSFLLLGDGLEGLASHVVGKGGLQ